MKINLTVKEALSLGYLHYDDGTEWAQLIEDIDPDDEFPHGATLYHPKPQPLVEITNDILKDILSEWVYNYVEQRVEEESVADKAFKTIESMDFSQVADMINAPFKNDIVYEPTNIQLIP